MTPGSAFVLGILVTILVFIVASLYLSAFTDDQDKNDDQWPGHRGGYGEF